MSDRINSDTVGDDNDAPTSRDSRVRTDVGPESAGFDNSAKLSCKHLLWVDFSTVPADDELERIKEQIRDGAYKQVTVDQSRNGNLRVLVEDEVIGSQFYELVASVTYPFRAQGGTGDSIQMWAVEA